MTLDEAIKHAEEVAEENQAIVDACDYYGDNMAKCDKCAEDHRQLARWLKDYKRLLKESEGHKETHNEDISKNIAIAFQFGLAMGFVKKCDECNDCISRQVAVDYLCTHCPDDAECLGDCDTIKNFKSFPSVTPKPKIGHWIPIVVRGQKSYCCSECLSECCYTPTAFCPDCGCKMVESEGE